MPQIDVGVKQLQGVLDKFLKKESSLANIELECRLGRLLKQPTRRFNANLTKAAFFDVKAGLDKHSAWVARPPSHYRQTGAGRERTRLYEDGRCVTVTKKRLLNIDLQVKHTPLDVRVSLSREIEVPPDQEKQAAMKESDFASQRKRTSHRKKKTLWQTDATVIEANNRSTRAYQFELECLDLEKALRQGSHQLAKDCLVTLCELLEFAAPLDKNTQFKLAHYREFV